MNSSGTQHFPDKDLLLLLDGDLPTRRAYELKTHLSQCLVCRGRQTELEAMMLRLIREQEGSGGHEFGSEDKAVELLRARLAKMNAGESRAPGRFRFSTLALAAVVVLGLVGAGWQWSRSSETRLKPDPRFTPGLVTSLPKEQLCSLPAADDLQMVPASLATEVFHRYGIGSPRPRAYEVDYLITPALGGATDVRNLWPQLYSEGVWTSRVKDALEDYLQRGVCEGSIELAVAQKEISGDWIAAYRRHFRTEDPLAMHAGFLKDKPWE